MPFSTVRKNYIEIACNLVIFAKAKKTHFMFRGQPPADFENRAKWECWTQCLVLWSHQRVQTHSLRLGLKTRATKKPKRASVKTATKTPHHLTSCIHLPDPRKSLHWKTSAVLPNSTKKHISHPLIIWLNYKCIKLGDLCVYERKGSWGKSDKRGASKRGGDKKETATHKHRGLHGLGS